MPYCVKKIDTAEQLTHTVHKPILHIHFLRIIAAFFVIVNHTVSIVFELTDPNATWYLSMTWFFISKISVPVFLMITGALMLNKKDSPQKWIKRMVRITVITIIISIIYYCFYRNFRIADLNFAEFVRLFFKMQISNALWYLYVYLGLLSMLPIFQDMAFSLSKNRIQHLLFISLVVVGGLPLIALVFNVGMNSYLTLALISPYIGMVFAGYYIEHHTKPRLKEFIIASVTFLLLILFQVVFTRYLYARDPSTYLLLDERTYITIVGSAACVYIILKYLFSVIQTPTWFEKTICYIGNLTFGIYLFADMIIFCTRNIIFHTLLSHIHILPALLIWEGIIFISCSIITAILKRIPIIAKWI